jgi:hypothetical protein
MPQETDGGAFYLPMAASARRPKLRGWTVPGNRLLAITSSGRCGKFGGAVGENLVSIRITPGCQVYDAEMSALSTTFNGWFRASGALGVVLG